MAASLDQIPSGLPRDANATALQRTYANIESGSVTVVTAGTPVALAATYTEAKRLTIQNPTSNSVAAYVGGSGVKNAAGGPKGIPILPNNTYELGVTDLSKVYVDADANGVLLTYNYQW